MTIIYIDQDNRGIPVQFGGADAISYIVTADEEDKQWRDKTNQGLDDYLHHHDSDGYDKLTVTIMEMYGSLITKYALQYQANAIVDVGCGVGKQRPIYARKLPRDIAYLGLDPIRVNEDRSYDYLCAKVEDLDWINIHNRYDLALFATSLDHFLDIDIALNSLKNVMNKDGHLIFWIGLHDSRLVAEMSASRVFARIFSTKSFLKRMVMLAGWLSIRLPRLLLTCKLRENRLRSGLALDRFHFHYFVESDIEGILSRHGKLVELVRIPGTNSLFAVLKI